MGRFLFVVPPLAEHIRPTLAVGRELTARGHRVAWAGHPEVVEALLPTDALFLPVDTAVPRHVRRAMALQPLSGRGLRGPAALKTLWENVLLPLAHSMVPGVRTAVEEFAPDVVVADQQALAGGAVAQLLHVPWATTTTTLVELAHPLGTMPLVARWIRGLLLDLMIDVGIDDEEAVNVDPRFSSQLVVAFTTEALVGASVLPKRTWVCVGPCLDERAADAPFAWTWLDGRPLVVVAPGGRPGAHGPGEGFLRVAVEALAGMDVQAVVVAPPDLLPSPPANVVVTPEVPSSALLALAAVVVTHGDHGTVGRALGHGVPLVVVPLHDDQPVVAQQVVLADAGVRLRLSRVHAAGLRVAVEAALFEPRLRAGAAKVRDSFARAGGARRAADRIEGLVGTTLTARESA